MSSGNGIPIPEIYAHEQETQCRGVFVGHLLMKIYMIKHILNRHLFEARLNSTNSGHSTHFSVNIQVRYWFWFTKSVSVSSMGHKTQ